MSRLPRLATLRCLLLPLVIMGLGSAVMAEEQAQRRPNLLLIFADDLGYADLGCYGGTLVETPNLDRLAAQGVRFTDGHVTCPVCAPSRMGLMSGAYQQRFGVYWNEDRRKALLPDTQKLLPELLREAGYATGHIGKWNIARDPRAAFDEVHDLIDWESDYFPGETGHYVGTDATDPKEIASSKVQYWRAERPGEEYLTDRIGRHAVEFIERHQEHPFFLYLAFNAVHSPWQAKAEDQARFSHLPHEVLRLYASMIASLDENVGRVLDALAANGLDSNTLVVFLSDNGPARGGPHIVGWPADWPESVIVGSADPLRGYKAQIYEGGHRVPFLMRWPGQLPAGETSGELVSSFDVLPTFCAAAGARLPEGSQHDGMNLLPALRGEGPGRGDQPLFWKTSNAGAARQGSWKLVIPGPGQPPELYDLAADIGEHQNLAASEPARLAALLKAFQDWEKALPPPASSAPARPAAARQPGR